MTDRDKLRAFLECSNYDNAIKDLTNRLRLNLIYLLGGDWKQLRENYGLYTISARPKETDRTLEKFDRMQEEGHSITAQNFYDYMPDLAGARLLLVDPEDIFSLAEKIRGLCPSQVFEPPLDFFKKQRLRHGRLSAYTAEVVEKFENAGYDIANEDAGYCSVHFVFRIGERFFPEGCLEEHTGILNLHSMKMIPKTEWHVEIQVRTIMEEAWGETDHFVRYANRELREDPATISHFAALSGYLQAANHHVSLIRRLAKDYQSTKVSPEFQKKRGDSK
jgi:putative GTP pyrophosphokinase